MLKKLKWATKQRLREIELCLWWHNRLTTNMLMEKFQIERRQATKDIKLYRELRFDNIVYNPTKRCYEATSNFNALFITTDINEYLQWDKNKITSLPINKLFGLYGNGMFSNYLNTTNYYIAPATLQTISQSIEKNTGSKKFCNAVNITFFNDKRNDSIVFPTNVAKVGFTYYIRIYEYELKQYQLIDISQIAKATMIDCHLYPEYQEDCEWSETTKLKIQIVPFLPDSLSEHIQSFVSTNPKIINDLPSYTFTVHKALENLYRCMLKKVTYNKNSSIYVCI